MNPIVLTAGDLRVVVGANEAGEGAWADHRAGYNGIWSLTSRHNPTNVFVPAYAGLNLEHCMDDLFMTNAGGDAYEPRHTSMQVSRHSASSVNLTQSPTPLTGVETETFFELVEPYTLEMRFKATFHRPPRAGNWFGFFWASYIDAPACPALQFLDPRGVFNCLSPDRHGHHGANTVCHASVEQPSLGTRPDQYAANSLAHSFSSRRFSSPMMFGRPGDGSMLFLQLFDQPHALRLCMSPSGGGLNASLKRYNPAWDFQYIIDDAATGVDYRFRSRIIYKPYTGLDEIEHFQAAWAREIGL